MDNESHSLRRDAHDKHEANLNKWMEGGARSPVAEIDIGRMTAEINIG